MMRIELATALAIALAASPVAAQGYEAEVYRSTVLARRTIMFELHTSYTIHGPDPSTLSSAGPPDDDRRGVISPVMFDPVCYNPDQPYAARAPASASTVHLASIATGCDLYRTPTLDHTLHETLEMIVGTTSWSEFALYAFGSKQGSASAQWVGASFRTKLQVPQSWHWPVGMALATEVEYERSPVTIATWTWEIRPIIDRSFGRWYVAFNPTVARRLRGPGTVDGVNFSPSGKLSFDATHFTTLGVEYYGAYGRIGSFAASSNRLQQLYAAADLHLSPLWELNFGIGAGLTPATSQLAVKLILGRALTW